MPWNKYFINYVARKTESNSLVISYVGKFISTGTIDSSGKFSLLLLQLKYPKRTKLESNKIPNEIFNKEGHVIKIGSLFLSDVY